MKNKVIDKGIDALFDKTNGKVILLALLGFILRIISAINTGVFPDDVNQAVVPIGIFQSGKLVHWAQSTALWYYIEGVFYKIFGPTQIGSRFTTVLFGTFLIILMFVFVKKVFKSEKAALISSFLVAVSPALIKATLPEMDVAICFFTLLSAYFLFSYFENGANKKLMLSALFIGVAIMVKLYAAFFAVSFLIFFIYKEFKSGANNKKMIKRVLLFGLIVFVLCVPTLVHNYLLYKDKGYMDLIFTRTLGFGKEKAAEFYSWDAGWAAKAKYAGFFLGHQKDIAANSPIPGFLMWLWVLFKVEPIIFLFGLIGLISASKKNKNYFWFFIITLIPAFIYLGAIIPMVKHFIWIFALATPLAGNTIKNISNKLNKIRLRYVLLVILLFNLFYLGMPLEARHFYSKSPTGQLIEFKEKNIPENALIIGDSRIYRGRIHWALNSRSYVEASQFFDIANKLNQQGNTQPIEVYYVECVSDDCGWGTVKEQPDFNASMEEVTLWFTNYSIYSEDFEGPDESKYYFPLISQEKRIEYRIYKLSLNLNPQILEVVKQTHVWFMYPVDFNRNFGPIFDDYETHNFIDASTNKIAWLIFYFEFLVSFFAIFYVIYLFLFEK